MGVIQYLVLITIFKITVKFLFLTSPNFTHSELNGCFLQKEVSVADVSALESATTTYHKHDKISDKSWVIIIPP